MKLTPGLAQVRAESTFCETGPGYQNPNILDFFMVSIYIETIKDCKFGLIAPLYFIWVKILLMIVTSPIKKFPGRYYGSFMFTIKFNPTTYKCVKYQILFIFQRLST